MALPTGAAITNSIPTLQPEQKKLRILIHSLCKIDDGTLFAEVDLRKYAIESGQAVTNATLQELCAVHPKIASLILSNCDQISDVGLWALAKHCTNIQKLFLSQCNLISHVGLRALSLKCSKVIEIDLSFCHLIDDNTLTVVAGGNWKIQRLNLQHCPLITDTGVARIAQGMTSHLVYLNLNGCPNIGEFGDRALRELGANCRNLEELYLGETKRIEDPGCIILASGCPKLKNLYLSGCENITKKTLKTFGNHFQCLQTLKIRWNRKLQDNDYSILHDSNLSLSKQLTSLELSSFETLGDKGVAAICKSIGRSLQFLCFRNCKQLTDYSSLCISHLCPDIRALDFSDCGHITDESVHHLAQRLRTLTSLKLDGNNRITNKTLLRYIGREFEFVDMANNWLGYQPRPKVEDLIRKRAEFILHTTQAIKIQSIIRRKFAHRIYWERYREHLMTQVIPLFQAHVRGYFQRKRYRVIQQQLHRIRMATIIQSKWRKYFALHERIRVIKKKRFGELCQRMAVEIQRVYRGHKGRMIVTKVRTIKVNESMIQAKSIALKEMRAKRIQRIFRGYVARKRVFKMHEDRVKKRARRALEVRCMRLIQRIGRGKIGRIRARQRREQIANWLFLWNCARNLQRVYRGHVGRLRFKHFLELEGQRRKNVAAIVLQRSYRGYRGRLLAQVARALKALRIKHQYYAVELQRFLRGCMGRHYFAMHKEQIIKYRRQYQAAKNLQRVYRGYKGREARDIERELLTMEHRAKPLFTHLRTLEEKANKLRVTVHRLEGLDKIMRDNLVEVQRELEQCLRTTSKYTDSARVTGVPQRYLTKFLKVRLQDHYEHEEEVHKQRYIELQSKRADLRDLDRDILLAQRELIPLTTGLIAEVKRRRVQILRDNVRRKRVSATAVQALWRRALVRCSLYDPYKEYWVSRIDRDHSDKPYYLNTMTKEIRWDKPLAWRYFGDRVPHVEVDYN